MHCLCKKRATSHPSHEHLLEGGSDTEMDSTDVNELKYKCEKGHPCEIRTNDWNNILSKCPQGHKLKLLKDPDY